MLITRKTDYAMRCVLTLAATPESTLTAATLARDAEVSEEFASKVAQALVKAGLLTSVRGVHGGYRLAHPPERISLLDVVEAVQGPLSINECVVEGLGCHRASECTVHLVWAALRRDIETRLRSTHFGALLSGGASASLAPRRTED